MINAANGIMYTDDVTKSAPITELIGPKKGTAKARNHIIATIGSRTKTLRKIDFVCTPTAFSQTRKTGWVKTTNPIAWCTTIDKMATVRQRLGGRTEKALERFNRISPYAQYTATVLGNVIHSV